MQERSNLSAASVNRWAREKWMARNAFVPFTSRDSQKVLGKKGGFVTGECALNACLSSGRCTHAHAHAHAGIQCRPRDEISEYNGHGSLWHRCAAQGHKSCHHSQSCRKPDQLMGPVTFLQQKSKDCHPFYEFTSCQFANVFFFRWVIKICLRNQEDIFTKPLRYSISN